MKVICMQWALTNSKYLIKSKTNKNRKVNSWINLQKQIQTLMIFLVDGVTS